MKKTIKLSESINFGKFVFISTSFIFLFVTCLSIGYSTFTETLEIEGDAVVRADVPVRFTSNLIKLLDNGGTEKASSKYAVDTITHHIELPNCDSVASYNVAVKNDNDYPVVIKSFDKVSWNNDNIDYEIVGFNIDTDVINAGSEVLFEIKFKNVTCNFSDNKLDSTLKMNVGRIYRVDYADDIVPFIDGVSPVSVVGGRTVTVNFKNIEDYNIKVIINKKGLTNGKSYTYSDGSKSTLTVNNGVATINNVNDDILFRRNDVIAVDLSLTGPIYGYANKGNITSVDFVEYIDLENADISWDITTDQNGLAYAWVSGTKMYIGSRLTLESQSLMSAFEGFNNVLSINFNDKLDTSNTTTMSRMFKTCRKLQSLDLSSFDTSSVVDMSNMFDSVQAITSLDLSNFDTSNVTNMVNMFISCSNVTILDLSNFDTSNVTSMSGMFYGETNLRKLNISSFVTNKVTSMTGMFYGAAKLENLDVSNFDTSKVTDMSRMFYGNTSLLSLDLSNFNTENVTQMLNMFYNCKKLTSLDLSNFNTSKVIGFDGMFNSCSGLTNINLSNISTIKASSFSNMFRGCTSLTTLDLSSFSTSTVKIMDNMFYNDSKLSKIYVSDMWNTNGILVGKGENLFYGCTSLSGAISYDSDKVSADYANIDSYLTLK